MWGDGIEEAVDVTGVPGQEVIGSLEAVAELWSFATSNAPKPATFTEMTLASSSSNEANSMGELTTTAPAQARALASRSLVGDGTAWRPGDEQLVLEDTEHSGDVAGVDVDCSGEFTHTEGTDAEAITAAMNDGRSPSLIWWLKDL